MALAILKTFEPADHLLTPLRSVNRLARCKVAKRGQRFTDYSMVMAIKKLARDARCLVGRKFGLGLIRDNQI